MFYKRSFTTLFDTRMNGASIVQA